MRFIFLPIFVLEREKEIIEWFLRLVIMALIINVNEVSLLFFFFQIFSFVYQNSGLEKQISWPCPIGWRDLFELILVDRLLFTSLIASI